MFYDHSHNRPTVNINKQTDSFFLIIINTHFHGIIELVQFEWIMVLLIIWVQYP